MSADIWKKNPVPSTLNMLNSVWPNDPIWRYKTGSTLSQVMACCLTAWSYYLHQCWLIVPSKSPRVNDMFLKCDGCYGCISFRRRALKWGIESYTQRKKTDWRHKKFQHFSILNHLGIISMMLSPSFSNCTFTHLWVSFQYNLLLKTSPSIGPIFIKCIKTAVPYYTNPWEHKNYITCINHPRLLAHGCLTFIIFSTYVHAYRVQPFSLLYIKRRRPKWVSI